MMGLSPGVFHALLCVMVFVLQLLGLRMPGKPAMPEGKSPGEETAPCTRPVTLASAVFLCGCGGHSSASRVLAGW